MLLEPCDTRDGPAPRRDLTPSVDSAEAKNVQLLPSSYVFLPSSAVLAMRQFPRGQGAAVVSGRQHPAGARLSGSVHWVQR